MSKEKENAKKASGIGGLIFIGCMFIGAGIGMTLDAIPVGGAIGMGVGFIGMAAVRIYYRSKD